MGPAPAPALRMLRGRSLIALVDEGLQDRVVDMVCLLLAPRRMVGDIQPHLDDVRTKCVPFAHSPLEHCFVGHRLAHYQIWSALWVEGDHGPSWVVPIVCKARQFGHVYVGRSRFDSAPGDDPRSNVQGGCAQRGHTLYGHHPSVAGCLQPSFSGPRAGRPYLQHGPAAPHQPKRSMNDLEAFAKLVQALDPWRGRLVFIGGWSA